MVLLLLVAEELIEELELSGGVGDETEEQDHEGGLEIHLRDHSRCGLVEWDTNM